MPMNTRLRKVVIYNEELPLIKLHDPSITYSCEVMLENKHLITQLPLEQFPPNIVK